MGQFEFEGDGPIVWMFSGQGGQYFQMGRPLYEAGGPFRSWMDRLDAVAADYVGQSVVHVLYGEEHPKGRPFDHLLHTHPALFMVQYAMAQALIAEGASAPDYLFGTSLGEFVAAAVADAADVEAMLFDVIKQARLFEAHCGGGGMLVVIDDVATFHNNPVFANCELAGVNFDRCFVVSGLKNEIARVAETLRRQDVTHQVLPVSMAFHSSLVDGVQDVFVRTFGERAYRQPRMPVISCAATPYGPEAETFPRFSAPYWWNVIRQPIEFQRALIRLARRHPAALYLDLGPSGNMATFTKYNFPADHHDRILPVMTPFGHDVENLRAALGKLRARRGANVAGM
jgi:acyl transferase domain-containing protein